MFPHFSCVRINRNDWVSERLQQARVKGTPPTMGYRVVTVNLDVAETAWLDDLLERLKRKGLTKVTRSELMRLAVGQLQHELRGRSDAELVAMFITALQRNVA